MLTIIEERRVKIIDNTPYTEGVYYNFDIPVIAAKKQYLKGKGLGFNVSTQQIVNSEDDDFYNPWVYVVLASGDEIKYPAENLEEVTIKCRYNGRIEGIEEIEWVEVNPEFDFYATKSCYSKQGMLLDKYFRETPKEEIQRIMDEVIDRTEDAEGPTVDEYFEALGGGISRKQLLSFVSDMLGWISKENIKYDTQIPGNGNWYDKTGEGIATSNEELINLFIDTVYDKEGDN